MYVAGRQHSHRSPGRAPSLASEALAECSSADALSSTPFGVPVDPEVPITTAVPSATPFFLWPERTVVTPCGSSTVSGASASRSSFSRDAGSPASRGAMAGPLPSSAMARSSSSRGLVRSTRTAWRERFVTIVKVRSRN